MRIGKVLTRLLLVAGLLLGLAACPQDTRKFGAVVPLTGPADIYGKSIQRGLDLAYETVLSSGDLSVKMELTVEDSQSDPDRAKALIEQFFGNGALAVIGGVTSAEALAMVTVADEQERILLSPTASSPELSGASNSFFRIFPTSREEAVAMATFAKDTLELDKLTIVTEQGLYGEGVQTSVEEVFAGEIEKVVPFASGDDYAEIATMATESQPKGIYVAADGRELAAMIVALRDAGFGEPGEFLLTTTSLTNPTVLAEAGSAADGVYLTQTVFDLASEEDPMKGFVESFKTKYPGEEPDYFAAHGYDALMVFAQALREGGTATALPSEFKKGMRAVQNFPGVTGNIQFRESGDVQKFMRVYFVSDGQPQDFERYMQKKREELEAKRREIERERRRLMLERP